MYIHTQDITLIHFYIKNLKARSIIIMAALLVTAIESLLRRCVN